LNEEYRGIVDAGFLVQIDDPQLITYYNRNPDKSVAECRKWAEGRIEVLNHSLKGIPEEKIRFHTCYSFDMAPRLGDMELKDMLDATRLVSATRIQGRRPRVFLREAAFLREAVFRFGLGGAQIMPSSFMPSGSAK
jgi:hypothetical protein